MQRSMLGLWFGANDGSTRLWINGQPVPFVMKTKTKDKDGRETEEVAQTWEWTKGWRSFVVPAGQ